MQSSPNIGERSAKCVSATLKVSFPLQFWVFKPKTFKKKKTIKNNKKKRPQICPNLGSLMFHQTSVSVVPNEKKNPQNKTYI